MNFVKIFEEVDTAQGLAERMGFLCEHNTCEVPGYGPLNICKTFFASGLKGDRVFGAGGLVDFCALQHFINGETSGERAYMLAVETLVSLYAKRLPYISNDTILDAAMFFLARRRISNYFREVAFDKPSACAYTVAKQKDRERLSELFYTLFQNTVPLAAGDISPIYATPARIVGVRVTPRTGQHKEFMLENQAHALLYLGLEDWFYRAQTYISTTPRQLDNLDVKPAETPVCCVAYRSGGESAWVPEGARFAGGQADEDLILLMTLATHGTVETQEGRAAKEDLVETLSSCIVESGIRNQRAEHLLKHPAMSENLRRQLRERLQTWAPPSLLREFDSASPPKLVTTVKSANYYAAWDGYFSDRDGEIKQLSNFIVTPKTLIVFPQGDTAAFCELDISGHAKSGVIAVEALSNPQALEKAVQYISAPFVEGFPVPNAYSPRELNPICVSLRKELDALPVIDGIDRLGWNLSLTQFIGAGYRITNKAVTFQKGAVRPGVVALSCFDCSKEHTRCELEDLASCGNGAWLLAFYAAGCVARHAAREKNTPLALKTTSQNEHLLQLAFSGLAQESVISLGGSARTGVTDSLGGMPVWGEALSDAALYGAPYNVVALRPSGRDGGDAEGAGSLLLEAVITAAQRRFDTIDLPVCRSFSLEDLAIKQGREILAEAWPDLDIPEVEEAYPALANALQEKIPYDYLLSKNIVELTIPDEEAAREAILCCRDGDYHGGVVSVPAEQGLNLLKGWYGALY